MASQATSTTQSQDVEMVSQTGLSSSSNSRILARPIVIPQVTHIYLKSLTPFSRAYPPALADLPDPIPQPSFLAFLDALNTAWVSNPYSQLLWLLTYAPLVVPIFYVQLAGGLAHVIAALSTFAVTAVRTRICVRRANRDLFTPRGLRCVVLTTKQMMRAVGAEGAGRLALPSPSGLEGLEGYDGSGDVVTDAEDPQVRRVRAVGESVMPLSWDVGREPMVGGFARAHLRALNRRSLNSAVTRRADGLKEVTQETTALAADLAMVNREIAVLEGQGRTPSGLDGDFAAKLQKRRQVIEEIKLVGSRKLAKADKKEEAIANKMLWIVITRVDHGGCIEDLPV